MKPLRIFFSGVGGQGTLTATRLLAETALENGMEVTAGEIHGMAQRGGVVHSFVLVGGYMSPKISHAEADILLGFEPLETLRALPFLRPGGLALSSDTPIPPLSVPWERNNIRILTTSGKMSPDAPENHTLSPVPNWPARQAMFRPPTRYFWGPFLQADFLSWTWTSF